MSRASFQRFDRSGGRRVKTPRLHVSRDQRRIGINLAAHRAIGLSPYVVLLVSPEDGRIGIEPTSGDDPDGYRVSRARTIWAAPFLRTVNLPSGLHSVTVEDGMLVTEVLK